MWLTWVAIYTHTGAVSAARSRGHRCPGTLAGFFATFVPRSRPVSVPMDLRQRVQESLSGTHTIERELGGGGRSRVFVASEHRLGRKVVVKILAPELAAAISAERFERETRLAASLQQANILPSRAPAIQNRRKGCTQGSSFGTYRGDGVRSGGSNGRPGIVKYFNPCTRLRPLAVSRRAATMFCTYQSPRLVFRSR